MTNEDTKKTNEDTKKERLRMRGLLSKYSPEVMECIWRIEVKEEDAVELLDDELKEFMEFFETLPRDSFIFLRDLLTYLIDDADWYFEEDDEE